MAKLAAGVLAVSIAALLFAGCGDQSPAQKICDDLEARRKDLEVTVAQFRGVRDTTQAEKTLADVNQQRRNLGC